jgi:hypothetical protein
MNKLYSVAIGVFAVTLIASAAQADGPDISAQRLLDSWKAEDPGIKMVAEVIASAFSSGLSWKGSARRKGNLLSAVGLQGGKS